MERTAVRNQPTQRIRAADLRWLLAYPIYQTIGTIRHEASHALVALVEGGRIERFIVWPSLMHGRWLFGEVEWSGPVNWVAVAAPYLGDVVIYALFFVICTRLPISRHWVWLNLVILGLISPLLNSAYEYLLALAGRSDTDVGYLLAVLPAPAVHVYFVVTLLLYVVGLARIAGFPSAVYQHIMHQAP
jgi:hypothetical protein